MRLGTTSPYVTAVAVRPGITIELMAGRLILKVGTRRVVVNHPERVVRPRDGSPPRTKLDLRGYYSAVADGMPGPSSIWYRMRINLQHIPADRRPPPPGELIAGHSPWSEG